MSPWVRFEVIFNLILVDVNNLYATRTTTRATQQAKTRFVRLRMSATWEFFFFQDESLVEAYNSFF